MRLCLGQFSVETNGTYSVPLFFFLAMARNLRVLEQVAYHPVYREFSKARRIFETGGKARLKTEIAPSKHVENMRIAWSSEISSKSNDNGYKA